ncbi:MAG: pyruvate dehydrogenase complex dihydrolipoamide acetyltransferase [Alphaproteobacteria bacterium]|nr:pyruvate dehydrogenase complex dihydrolipoamide acetyltransferase [Alphaproteobacteria bacterium]
MPIKITMPALSPTMTDGTLAKWLKSVGDTIEAGDVIAEIETDKATMEVEAVDDGVLGKIIVQAGTENVPVNDVIAVLLDDGENVDDITDDMISCKVSVDNKTSKADDVPSLNKSPNVNIQNDIGQVQKSADSERIFASPLAKRIAADKGLDLSSIKGSGPKGRIIKADVENANVGSASEIVNTIVANVDIPVDTKVNQFGQTYIEIPNNNIKKVTAQRLLESTTTIPHFYLTVDCQLNNLLDARKDINERANGEYKLSVNDFIVKATAMALKAYPAANVSWTDEAVHQYLTADVSVAVSTPNGLITPIVKSAETKGMREISDEVKALAGKAREGKLQPEEFQGGSFTISNLGMFGVKEFAAIINPPQGCILAIGAGEQRPVVENGEIKIKTIMSCTLSTDHRTVDGAIGAEWLKIFKQYIENPVSMLV